MKHYADQGYEIALDDVGAGHSGLNRVVNTTPDYLKADIELVRDIYKYKKKEIMMKLLLDYCNATGAILIAEGIETARSWNVCTAWEYITARDFSSENQNVHLEISVLNRKKY